MTINRVQGSGFAQVANAALRDQRLSFRARGILAMVLSYSGEWDASRDWLETMSGPDGREAIQSALNELNDLGYREVIRTQLPNGTWRTDVNWLHTPGTDVTEGRVSRPPVEPVAGEAVLLPEHHQQNTENSQATPPSSPPDLLQFSLMQEERRVTKGPPNVGTDEQFARFWTAYPKKVAKAAAAKAFKAAIKKASLDAILTSLDRQKSVTWRDTEKQFIPNASTWLNQERWDDEVEPRGRGSAGRADDWVRYIND